MMRRGVLVGVLAVFLVATLWGVTTVLANQRRDEAVAHLLATVDGAADGQVLSLREAFDLPWDRAVVIHPYSPGSLANQALALEHYPSEEVVTQGDGVYLLVFAQGDTFVADVALYGQAFYFDEAVTTIDPEKAQFKVVRDVDGVVLVPV